MTQTLTSQNTVGQLVAEHPGWAKLFETWGIDYCCGGKKSLQQACAEQDLDLAALLKALTDFADQDTAPGAEYCPTDSLTQLSQHIVAVHHQYLYDNLPRLKGLVEKVAQAHGTKDPRLAQLNALFRQLCQEVEPHLAKEERVLFPYCQQLDKAEALLSFHCGSIAAPIGVMEKDHEDLGQMLRQIRALTDDLTPPVWACNTLRVLYEGLRELEGDLHQHIHKENNLLFPMALAKAHQLGLKRG